MRFGSRYDSFDDPYCYPGTFVLKNKLALTEDSQLEAFEHESVSAKAEEKLPSGPFDPKHYGDIHRHLFGEVYEWAGDYRTVRTAKGGDMFCYPEFIAEQMELLFGILQNAPFLAGSSQADFVTASARFLGDLNAIHPFREGNGRSQLSFLFLLGERAGHPLDMSRVRAKAMLTAMLASFNGRPGLLEGEIRWLCIK